MLVRSDFFEHLYRRVLISTYTGIAKWFGKIIDAPAEEMMDHFKVGLILIYIRTLIIASIGQRTGPVDAISVRMAAVITFRNSSILYHICESW